MTDEQFERLPSLLQEIVKIDRLIAHAMELLGHQETWNVLPRLLSRRAELRQAAERVWGYQLKGDANGRTA
jgi:hypothetical protein